MGFATLGAALAGAVCAPLLKHSKGWVAALGALVATALGASLGGAGFISIADPTLAVGLILGLILGPVVVLFAIFTDAVVFAVWALSMVGVRILSVWLRRRAAQS